MKTVLITGGTGLLGRALTEALLQRGFLVTVLTRDPERQKPNHQYLKYAGWNLSDQKIDREAIATADYIIHLAGTSVSERRWTTERKKEIISSRVDSGKLIVESIKTIPNKIKAIICASATGWYGPDLTPNPRLNDSVGQASPQSGEEGKVAGFNETDPAATDFLGQTCKQWEAAIEPVADLDVRLVRLRIGIVLSKDGGALKEFRKPLKFGIATILGSGTQIISWIHIDDVVRMFLYMLDNENLSGTFNAVSPNPVTNKELILQLAKSERGKNFIPIHVPSIALKISLGEMSVEILKSSTVSAKKIIQAGFIFQYPSIKEAIIQLKSSRSDRDRQTGVNS